MKHIDPVTLVLLGGFIALVGVLLSVIGGGILGTSLSEARDPTAPGFYRRTLFGLYKEVPAPNGMREINPGVQYRFVPVKRGPVKFVADGDGVLHRLKEAELRGGYEK